MDDAPSRSGPLRSLWDLLLWLWERSSAPERDFRRKCMAIHTAIAGAYAAGAGLGGGNQPSALWLSEYCTYDLLPLQQAGPADGGGAAAAADAEEEMVLAHLGLPPPPTPGPIVGDAAEGGSAGGTAAALRGWLRGLEAKLQWAAWAGRQGMLKPRHVNAAPTSGSKAGLRPLSDSIKSFLLLLFPSSNAAVADAKGKPPLRRPHSFPRSLPPLLLRHLR